MPSIEVLLEVPPKIEEGLADGTLERIGGVIRHSKNGQIVAHLREGGQISSNPQLTQGLMGGLLGHAGMSSATIRHIILRTTVLNTAVAGFTLLMMVNRIRGYFEKQFKDLEKQIKGISAEFDQDRWNKLASALESIRDVAEAESDSYKLDVPKLNRELNEGRKHILHDVDAVLHKDSLDPEQGQNAQDYLLEAMHVDTMRIRCYLEIDEHQMARDRLKDVLEEHKKRTQTFVLKWLGAHPARYFHELVDIEDLKRYIRIEGWLNHGKDDVLMDVIKKCRGDFWNQDANPAVHQSRLQRGINRINSIPPFNKLRQQSKELPRHLRALEQSELLIENYKRLYMCERELDAIERLGGLEEWKVREREALTDKADFNIDKHDDYVLLVDTDMLKRLSA